MKTHSIGIVMNGVTGRMGTNQHLVRSILAIRKQGGVKLSESETIMPEPVLVGEPVAEVLQPGLMTRIVGPAAYTCYSYGIAAGGPFDPELAALANRVVGNRSDSVVLECAAVGPGLRFLRPANVAAYGARVSPLVNGCRASQHAIEVDQGDLLTFGRITEGFRIVIAIDGGIEDPRARYTPRPTRLHKGDVIHGAGLEATGSSLRPVSRKDASAIHVAVGPHPVDDYALSFFFSTEWLVTPHLNRLGIRINRKRLHSPPRPIFSLAASGSAPCSGSPAVIWY